MENQIVLAPSIALGKLYFSLWKRGQRVPGSFSPFKAVRNLKTKEPHNDEKLSEHDHPILLEPLIKWSE